MCSPINYLAILVLNSAAPSGVTPLYCVTLANDKASTALEATLELDPYFALFIHGINQSRTYPETRPALTFPAKFLIYLDMALFS